MTTESASTNSADRKRPVLLLAVAVLFVGWIGYLAYLALTTRNPIVLSRPQLLAADVVVLGRVDALDGPVVVEKVVRAAKPEQAPAEGKPVEIRNLSECKDDWGGAGRYLLPLTAEPGGKGYRVTAIPRSPGYFGGSPRIYRATPRTEAQIP